MISLYSQDFYSLREELLNLAKAKGLWKDAKESSIATFLIELIAWLGQAVYYNLNETLKENFISTAERPESIYRLVELLNYRIEGAHPAWGEATFTLSESHTADITIPAGTILKTDNNIYFTTIEDGLIAAGDTSVNVKIVQGIYQQETLKATGEEWQRIQIEVPNFFVADNENSLNEEIISGFEPVIVKVNGEQWSKVDTFVDQSANAKVFTVGYVENKAFIKFGNGTFGFVPPSGAVVEIQYFITQGLSGNVNAGEITTIVSSIKDANGEDVRNISVNNTEDIVNGSDPQTAEEVKLQAPRIFSLLYRGVTKKDIKTLIQNYSSVKDVQIYAEEDYSPPNFRMFNVVEIIPLLENSSGGYELPTEEFFEELDTYLKQYIPLTIQRLYTVPQPLAIDVKVEVKVKSSSSKAKAKTAIETAIRQFFNSNLKIAGAIRHSDITNVIDDLADVDYVHVFLKTNSSTTYVKEDITAGKYEFPVLNSIEVSFL